MPHRHGSTNVTAVRVQPMLLAVDALKTGEIDFSDLVLTCLLEALLVLAQPLSFFGI